MAIGCSSDGDSSTPVAPTAPEVLDGTFDLQQVRVQGDGADVTLTPPAVSGSVTVTSDGRFTATLNVPDAGYSGTFSGSYVVSGNTLTLTYDDGTVEVWTISEDRTMVSGTFVEDGMTVTPTFAMA
jgi:hypothetical protein